MARFIRSIIGYNDPIAVPWRVAASQTITEGDIVELDATSRYLKNVTSASTTLVGIAQESITTGASITPDDKISIIPFTDVVIRVGYTGATKTTLADTDLATTKFDINSPTTINLDDTTGGMCTVVGYDNVRKTADILIADANIVKLG